MDFRQKRGIQSNLSLPLDKSSNIEVVDDFFRLHQESPPIEEMEDDAVYSFANHQISSSQRYDAYNQSLEGKPSRDTNTIYTAFQANQQQPQFLTINGQPDYNVYQKINQQASPSFSNEAHKGINIQNYGSVNIPERESVKKQIVNGSAHKHQITSPSWTSPSSTGQKLFIEPRNSHDNNSRKDSISSNIYSHYSHAPELNDSFTKNSDTYNPKVNTRRSTIGEEAVEVQKGNPVSTSNKSSGALSSESKQVSGACLVLEEATQEALRNIASKLVVTSSTRGKHSLKDPLNNSLLSKHLDGEKRAKTPSSVTQQKKKTVGVMGNSSMTVRKDTKRDSTPNNAKLNKSIDKGYQSSSASKSNKEDNTKRTPSKTRVQSIEQKNTSKSAVKSELNKSATAAKNNSSMSKSFVMQGPTLTESDKMDANQRLRTADYGTEGGQEMPSDALDDVIIEKYHTQLMTSIQKLTMRTFLALRGIIRPNEYILACCQAFVKLFAGLNDAIPPSFAIMATIEWENIKILFNNPVKVLKLISTLPVFIEYRKMPHRNINAAIATLSKIPYDIGDTQNEAFYQMYEFIVSAVEYYKFYKPDAAPSFPLEDTPTNRRSTVPEVPSSLETVDFKASAKDLQPQKSVREESVTIGFSTPAARSKSPLGQHKQNLASKSAYASTASKTVRTSVSPFKENVVSSRKNSQEAIKKTNASQYNSSHRKSAASIKSSGSVNASAARPTKSSLSPMRSVNSSVRNMTAHESFDLGNDRSRSRTMKTEISEMADFEDDAARKRREGLSYKARASRLLADHERYIKKMVKAQEEEKERINRELNSYDREMLADYVEAKAKAEKTYYKEMVAEEFAARKEAKQKQERIQRFKQNDGLIDTVKNSSFVAAQAEKKKHEKKKELWDQYKKKMAEKLAKKQKEAEQINIQKKEAVVSKVVNLEWKKKQVAEERDKWKENYLLIEKLVGEAK